MAYKIVYIFNERCRIFPYSYEESMNALSSEPHSIGSSFVIPIDAKMAGIKDSNTLQR